MKNCVKYINYSVTDKIGKFGFSYFVNGSLLRFYLQLLRFYFIRTLLILNCKKFWWFLYFTQLLVLKFLNTWSSNDLHPHLFHFNTSSFNFAQSEWVENSLGHFLLWRRCTRMVCPPGYQLSSCHVTLHRRHRKLTSVWSMLSVASTSFALIVKECMSGFKTNKKNVLYKHFGFFF